MISLFLGYFLLFNLKWIQGGKEYQPTLLRLAFSAWPQDKLVIPVTSLPAFPWLVAKIILLGSLMFLNLKEPLVQKSYYTKEDAQYHERESGFAQVPQGFGGKIRTKAQFHVRGFIYHLCCPRSLPHVLFNGQFINVLPRKPTNKFSPSG